MSIRDNSVIAERVASRFAATGKLPKVVHVQIEGWGGKRKIPQKELVKFNAALKNAPELRWSSVGFDILINGPHVQIEKKFLPELEKVVKAQGRRMGKPRKPSTNIYGLKNL